MGDEDLYQAALKEFESGSADEALLAKAWVNANGEDHRQKVEYVRLRVSQLKAERIKRTFSATGAVAKSVAPSVLGFAEFSAKIAALVLMFALGVTFLANLWDEVDPGSIAGSVLAGLLVIYLISILIERVLLGRMAMNRSAMICWSATASFLLVFALWYSGIDKSYALHPSFLSTFLLASILLAAGRISLSQDGRSARNDAT